LAACERSFGVLTSSMTNGRRVVRVAGNLEPTPMRQRIGEILVRNGVLTPVQCARILDEQSRTHRPFGELAEIMFNVTPHQLEEAWAEQYESITARVDPLTERVDRLVAMQITRRQAWQFRVLPLRMDGTELLICTCREHLPRAVRFAYQHFGTGCYFVMSSKDQLTDALEHYYPMDGAASVLRATDEARALVRGEVA